MLKFCGVALCAVMCIMVLKNHKGELSAAVGIITSVILISMAMAEFTPAFDFANEIVTNTEFGEYFTVLMKAMGITMAVQFTSEICRDCGEGGIASKLELAGKVEVMILCLPFIKELISLAADIMNA